MSGTPNWHIEEANANATMHASATKYSTGTTCIVTRLSSVLRPHNTEISCKARLKDDGAAAVNMIAVPSYKKSVGLCQLHLLVLRL